MIDILATKIQEILNINDNNFEDKEIYNILNNLNFTNFDFSEFKLNPTLPYSKFKLYNNMYFEIYIIFCHANKKSKIHDHSKNGCWLKVLNGDIVEYIYDKKLNLIKTNNLKKNDIGFMKDNTVGYHSICNISKNTAITLHIYSPVNHKTLYF